MKPFTNSARRLIADDAADTLTRVANHLAHVEGGHTVLDRIGGALAGHLRAASWDQTGSGRPPWCWTHQRDVTACHLDGLDCDGETIEVADPTGEAALTPDKAARDLTELDRRLRRIANDADVILAVLGRWTPRATREDERAKLTAINTPNPCCDNCSRVEITPGRRVWEPPLRDKPTNVGGVLSQARVLCRWCYEHVRSTGVVPDLTELRDRHQGNRVTCRHQVRNPPKA